MGTGKYPAVFSLVFFFRERLSNYHNRLCANQNRRAEESQAKAVLKDIIVAEMLCEQEKIFFYFPACGVKVYPGTS